MKSIKNIVFVAVIALIVVAQIYYLMTVYKTDKEAIANNLAEIESVKITIQQLEERLKRHEESKKELAQIQAEKTALEDKIPTSTVRAKFVSEFVDYIELMDALDATFSFENQVLDDNTQADGTTQDAQSNPDVIYDTKVTVKFVSTYATSRKLVEHLGNMYQACNVASYKFDTSAQTETGSEDNLYPTYFGAKLNSIGRTELVLDVYYRLDGTNADEVFIPGNLGNTNANPFRNPDAEKKNNNALAGKTAGNEGADGTGTASGQNTSETGAGENDTLYLNADFMLVIGDLLSSGDVYKLSGPGEKDNYIGMNSTKNMEINVTVYDDSYELSMKDSDGNTQSTSVKTSISEPTFRIISTMRELQTVMPNVHVNILNYSSGMMKISLTGSLLDNIHVYNKDKQEVLKGETKGNISLT